MPILIVNASENVKIESGANVVAELWCEFSGPENYTVSWTKYDPEEMIQLPIK